MKKQYSRANLILVGKYQYILQIIHYHVKIKDMTNISELKKYIRVNSTFWTALKKVGCLKNFATDKKPKYKWIGEPPTKEDAFYIVHVTSTIQAKRGKK